MTISGTQMLLQWVCGWPKSVPEHRHCIRHLTKARQSLLKELRRGGEQQ